jgi:membrane protease subunit HflC
MMVNLPRNKALRTLLLVMPVVLAGLLYAVLFSVDVSAYAAVSRFGRIVRVVEQPGLQLKWPFDQVLRLDKRLLHFNPPQAEYLTADKKNLLVHSLLLWRIVEPQRFLQSVGNRAAAEARLGDLTLARIGSLLGDYPFSALISISPQTSEFSAMVAMIHRDVAVAARAAYGIEVVDLRLRQLQLPEQNQRYVFERMQAERGRIAMEYRSEGEREAQKIIAAARHRQTVILAEAYRSAATSRGEAEAEVIRLYAERFGQNPGFYKFVRTLQAYEKILDTNTTLFLPAGAEAFRLLQNDALQTGE